MCGPPLRWSAAVVITSLCIATRPRGLSGERWPERAMHRARWADQEVWTGSGAWGQLVELEPHALAAAPQARHQGEGDQQGRGRHHPDRERGGAGVGTEERRDPAGEQRARAL